MKKILYSFVFAIFISSAWILAGCSSTSNSNVNNQKHDIIQAGQKDKSTKENKANSTSQQIPKTQNNTSNASLKLLNATIIKNIDGDTIDISLNGKEEKVRMLCVDTPETHHPRLGVQPFGPEASAFTKKTLYVGRSVQVELGVGGGRDKYGRLLAYIYVDGKMFNELLLEKGLARVAYIYAPNTKYVDEFYAIQKKAQQKGIGIWSIENYAKEDGYHSNAVQDSRNPSTVKSEGNAYQNNPKDDHETNLNCKGKIKGNVNSHIYHVPGGAFYDSTKDNIIWFCSEQDAQKAGFRKSKR